MSTPRAVLYVRLSVSHDTSTSIIRQREDLEALAEREGWTVAKVFADDGISGAKTRENAEAALRMIRDGEADALAVWKFDRWSRQGLGAVADLIKALDHREELARRKKGTPALFVALNDGLRSDQPAWRIIASVLAEVARQERENTRERTRSSIAKLRKSRRFAGGNVPTGYRTAPHPEGVGRALEPNEEETPYIKEAAERIVSGASLYATSIWLNGSPLRPRRADNWTVTALSQLLTGPAIVGRVTLHGEVLRDADGMPSQIWEPALPLDLWHSVRATIEARQAERAPAGERRRGRRSRLLSGLAVCAECTAPLYVRKASSGAAIYSCSAKSNGKPCPGVSVTAERLEEYIEAKFLLAVGAFEVFTPVEVEAPAVALVEAEKALVDVAARLGDPNLSEDEEELLLSQRRLLRDRVREHRATAESAPPEIQQVPTGETMRQAWEANEDVAARRSWLTNALHAVEVSKGGRGRKGLDPARVNVIWTS